MEREQFAKHLAAATAAVLPFTQKQVTDRLPGDVRYLVFLNQSYDGNPLVGDEEVHPEDTPPEEHVPEPVTAEQVVATLWRGGKVPEWVNVSVQSADEQFTYVELVCCGRFTATEDMVYHRPEGRAPFHVLGPPQPPGWRAEVDGPFDLNWQQRPRPRCGRGKRGGIP